MSDRVYFVNSDTILIEWVKSGEVKIETPTEQKAWEAYVDSWQSYNALNIAIRLGGHLSARDAEKLNNERVLLHNKLANLERLQSIQHILQRAELGGRRLKLRFASQDYSSISQTQKENCKTPTKPKKSEEKNDTPKFLLLPLFIAVILFISIAELPYGFYTFMRIVVPLLSVIYLFFAYMQEEKFSLMLIPNIIIAILWNPILPIYLDKDTWIAIDAIAGVCEIVMAIYAYRKWKQG